MNQAASEDFTGLDSPCQAARERPVPFSREAIAAARADFPALADAMEGQNQLLERFDGLLAAVNQLRYKPAPRARWWRQPPFWVGAAAAFLFVVWAGYPWTKLECFANIADSRSEMGAQAAYRVCEIRFGELK